MGRQSSHTAAALRLLAIRCIVLLQSLEYTAHRALGGLVVHEFVAHIYECKVNAAALGQCEALMVESECLAYAAAHFHAVNGMVEAFFRHAYKKSDRGVGASAIVAPGHSPELVGKARKLSATTAEEHVDGSGGAKFLFLVEAVLLHSSCCSLR